jgi:hypothetical protein
MLISPHALIVSKHIASVFRLSLLSSLGSRRTASRNVSLVQLIKRVRSARLLAVSGTQAIALDRTGARILPCLVITADLLH